MSETGQNAENDKQEAGRHQKPELSVQPDNIPAGCRQDDLPDDLSESGTDAENGTCDEQDILKTNGDQQDRKTEKDNRQGIKQCQ